MSSVALHYVWEYNDTDRAFWKEHLAGWLPRRLFDVHLHVFPSHVRREMAVEPASREHGTVDAVEPIDASTAQRCHELVLPERETIALAFGYPNLAYDVEACNDYVRIEALKRSWHSLAMLCPHWPAERVAVELEKPGVVGVLAHPAMLDASPAVEVNAGIARFLPESAMQVLSARQSWVTLHAPSPAGLADPQSLREIIAMRQRWGGTCLVLALGGERAGEESLAPAIAELAKDPGIFIDCAGVVNPAVCRLVLERFGPSRILYGSGSPMTYLRGREPWCDKAGAPPFALNADRAPADLQASHTLLAYEALFALRQACEALRLRRSDINAIFHNNAHRLVQDVQLAKMKRWQQGV